MHSIFQILDEEPDSAGPDLVSLDDLKLALGITGTADDEALQAQITFQSRIIAEYCERRFGRAEAMETFTFDRNEIMPARQALVLWLYPVTAVTEVSTDGATTLDYEFDPYTGRLWAPDGVWWAWSDIWNRKVTVRYSGGYDLPEEAPARLAKAVIEAVNEARMFGARDPTIREVAHGDTRISYFTSPLATGSSSYLSAPVADLIKPYRRLHVA